MCHHASGARKSCAERGGGGAKYDSGNGLMVWRLPKLTDVGCCEPWVESGRVASHPASACRQKGLKKVDEFMIVTVVTNAEARHYCSGPQSGSLRILQVVDVEVGPLASQ